jgi:hypothetical protein
MTRLTAILSAVILAFLQGCQKDASVSKISIPITAVATPNPGVSKPDPFPGFEISNNNTKDTYGCVGHVHNEIGQFIGSAVLIAPSVVLTAGHVIEGENLRYFITKDCAYTIEKTIIHPDYEHDNDIGIIILGEPCPETPAQMLVDRSELTSRESLTTVGFSKEIKKISKPGTFWYFGTTQEDPHYMRFIPFKGHIWFGDSGGGVFEDGGKLAGIIAAMVVVDYTVVDHRATRVDLYVDWIRSVMQEEGCSPCHDFKKP